MKTMTDPQGFALAGVKTKRVVLFFLLSLALIGAFALRPPAEVLVGGAMRAQAIDMLAAELNKHYVFPDTAKQIETLLRSGSRMANTMQ